MHNRRFHTSLLGDGMPPTSTVSAKAVPRNRDDHMCVICKRLFVDNRDLNRHIRADHPDSLNIIKDLRTTKKGKPMIKATCPICAELVAKNHLNSHLRMRHDCSPAAVKRLAASARETPASVPANGLPAPPPAAPAGTPGSPPGGALANGSPVAPPSSPVEGSPARPGSPLRGDSPPASPEVPSVPAFGSPVFPPPPAPPAGVPGSPPGGDQAAGPPATPPSPPLEGPSALPGLPAPLPLALPADEAVSVSSADSDPGLLSPPDWDSAISVGFLNPAGANLCFLAAATHALLSSKDHARLLVLPDEVYNRHQLLQSHLPHMCILCPLRALMQHRDNLPQRDAAFRSLAAALHRYTYVNAAGFSVRPFARGDQHDSDEAFTHIVDSLRSSLTQLHVECVRLRQQPHVLGQDLFHVRLEPLLRAALSDHHVATMGTEHSSWKCLQCDVVRAVDPIPAHILTLPFPPGAVLDLQELLEDHLRDHAGAEPAFCDSVACQRDVPRLTQLHFTPGRLLTIGITRPPADYARPGRLSLPDILVFPAEPPICFQLARYSTHLGADPHHGHYHYYFHTHGERYCFDDRRKLLIAPDLPMTTPQFVMYERTDLAD